MQAFREEMERRRTTNQLSWDLGVAFLHTAGREGRMPTLQRARIDGDPLSRRQPLPLGDSRNRIGRGGIRRPPVSAGAKLRQRDGDGQRARRGVRRRRRPGDLGRWRREFFRWRPGRVSLNELEGKEPVSPPYHYSEWDYQIQLERPTWATVLEKRRQAASPATSTPSSTSTSAGQPHQVPDRCACSRRACPAAQPGGRRRDRHQRGDRAMVDMRMGDTPDPRINIRYIRKTRDLAVMVLLDLSESTNEMVAGPIGRVLELTREAGRPAGRCDRRSAIRSPSTASARTAATTSSTTASRTSTSRTTTPPRRVWPA